MAVLQSSLEYSCEMWNTNKRRPYSYAHAKYIIGCSITTCDAPVCEDLGLRNLKNRGEIFTN